MVKNARILIVDDDIDIRDVVSGVLRSMGLDDYTEAQNGLEALEFMRRDYYDLVLCDWSMPKMTGIQLLMETRKHRILRRIPFIMITAESLPRDITQAIKAGAADYIVKPFEAKTLRERIEKIL